MALKLASQAVTTVITDIAAIQQRIGYSAQRVLSRGLWACSSKDLQTDQGADWGPQFGVGVVPGYLSYSLKHKSLHEQDTSAIRHSKATFTCTLNEFNEYCLFVNILHSISFVRQHDPGKYQASLLRIDSTKQHG